MYRIAPNFKVAKFSWIADLKNILLVQFLQTIVHALAGVVLKKKFVCFLFTLRDQTYSKFMLLEIWQWCSCQKSALAMLTTTTI